MRLQQAVDRLSEGTDASLKSLSGIALDWKSVKRQPVSSERPSECLKNYCSRPSSQASWKQISCNGLHMVCMQDKLKAGWVINKIVLFLDYMVHYMATSLYRLSTKKETILAVLWCCVRLVKRQSKANRFAEIDETKAGQGELTPISFLSLIYQCNTSLAPSP